jgi:beta-aspartyl-peptidase (threonine type)
MVGRIGDSAIIGAGTFANAAAAASATGHGEAIILASLCRETIEALAKSDPMRIARRKIAELIAPQRHEAGIIIVDRKGRIGYAHNAETMEVGIFDPAGAIRHERAAPIPSVRKPSK